MTITYPLAFPAHPHIAKIKIDLDAAVALSESPFTFEQQVYAHQGQRFKAAVTLPVQKRSFAEQWASWGAQLNGRQGTFLMGDPDATTPRGIATGTPLINGAGQTGNALNTKGWTHSTNGILLTGDYIQIGTGSAARMYKNLLDVNSDSSGNAALLLWPSLRVATTDGASIVTANCMTQWRLDAPFGWSANEVSTYSVSFSCSEAL